MSGQVNKSGHGHEAGHGRGAEISKLAKAGTVGKDLAKTASGIDNLGEPQDSVHLSDAAKAHSKNDQAE